MDIYSFFIINEITVRYEKSNDQQMYDIGILYIQKLLKSNFAQWV